MALQTLFTPNVTFIDYTDMRKLEVYISSNLPQTQIYNPNNKSYSPDWSGSTLKLTAEVFLDYEKVTPSSITWSKQIGGDTIPCNDWYNKTEMVVKYNEMTGDNAKSITYTCEVTYQNTSAFSKIVFTRVDTGLNGSNGKDGTSVTILGSYSTLSDLQAAHPTGSEGDSYIVDGDLYVWAANDAIWENVGSIEGPAGKDGQDAKNIILNANAQVFKVSKTGEITPKTITLTSQEINTTATSWTYSTNGGQTFLSIAPDGITRNGNIVTITGADITSNMIVIKASDGTYSDTYTIYKVFDGADGATGQSASMAFLTNENVTFSANQYGQIPMTSITTNVVAYNGTTKVTPTIGDILYLPDGITIDKDNIIELNNELILTITVAHNATLGSSLSNSGIIRIPIISPVNTVLILSWSKVNAGATGTGIKSVTVSYGVSESVSTQPTDWQSSVPDVAEGSYLWTRTITDYTDDSIPDTVTYTYAKQGVKGDTGSAGSSVTVSKIEYQAGASATVEPTGTWSSYVVSVADGNYLWTKTTFSDGNIAYGVARQGIKGDTGDAGRGVSSIVEQYYQSTSATTQSGGTWSSSVPTWSDGKYIWTRSVITYTDSTTSTTSPVCITGQKGGTGDTGIGISSIDVWYYQSTSATALSGGSWATTAPTWVDGKYVWTKTITTYTNNKTDETDAVCITGQRGNQGVQGPKGNDGQQYYTWVKYADTPTSGMSNDPDGKIYIGLAYNKTTATESNTYSDYTWSLIKGETGAVGPKGEDGKQYYTWIKYADNASGSGMSDSPNGKSYIGLAYNKTTSAESTTASDYTWSLFKGDKGDKGADAYTVILTNESHIFAGDVSNAIVGTAETQVLAYNGSTQQSVTIVSVNGKTATTSDTDTGITGLKFKCSALSSTSPKITFTCTTAFVSANGSIPIVLSVGGVQFTKMFTYSIAFKGTTGSPGNPGAPASLVDITPSALYFKSTTGKDGIFTPDYIYLYPRFQTVTYSKWEYSTNGGATWTAVNNASGTGVAVVTHNSISNTLRISRSSPFYTDTVTSISFKCVSSDSSVYDTVSIAKIYDVVDLKLGVSFQLYAPKGFLITNETPEVTLQTFAYEGDKEITDATFKWSSWDGETWVEISGATGTSLILNKTNVMKTSVYKCEMTYDGEVYESTATVEDKTDIYDSLIRVIAKQSPTNKMYWILYSTVYSEDGERDALLGTISETAPASPTTGTYWYKVDTTNYTVTLMKYSGTEWTITTDTQELLYDWFLFKDATDMITLGSQSKVKIVTANDFSRACSIQCNIFDSDYALLSRSSQVLNDPSDPIVSATEPPNPIDKQLWIKIADNGTYIISIWNEATKEWMTSEADSQNKVHVEKPTVYSAGDIWIVGGDYQPTIYVSGVAQTTKHLVGTMLKAQFVSSTYSDSDWVEALNYKGRIDDLSEQLNIYNQFFDFDETGLTMSAKNLSGQISDFKTRLTNTELGFYQGENKVAYINNNQLNISKAEINQSLSIVGTSPIFSIGDFSFVVESNGSLSIVTNN